MNNPEELKRSGSRGAGNTNGKNNPPNKKPLWIAFAVVVALIAAILILT